MTDTFGYDSPDMNYDYEVLYDGAVIASPISSGVSVGSPTVVPGPPGTPPPDLTAVKRKRGGGRPYKDSYYSRLQAPFINITVSAALKSINNEDLHVGANQIKYAGENSLLKIGIDSLKIRTKEPKLDVDFSLIENGDSNISSKFLAQETLEQKDIFEGEFYKDNHMVVTSYLINSNKDSLVVEGGKIIKNSKLYVSAGLIANLSENFIIKSKVITDR